MSFVYLAGLGNEKINKNVIPRITECTFKVLIKLSHSHDKGGR